MAIFGLSGFSSKKKSKKKRSTRLRINKSTKKKAKTCEFC